jgi:hypothetical protein
MATSKSNGNAKALFTAYQKADDEVTKAREALDQAMARRSDCVESIAEGLGEGPFEWQSRILAVAKRAVKDENKEVVGHTYYFKATGKEVTKVG